MYTQCVVVLVDDVPRVADLANALADADVLGERPGRTGEELWFGGPGLVVDYRGEVNGLVRVDIVDRPWPDSMGSPEGAEALLFGAWVMGNFGPCTFPGALEMALKQSRGWPDANRHVGRHRGFVRVQSSYVLGLPDDTPVTPRDYDAVDELRFVTDVQAALGNLPGAIAAFNPNAELVLPFETLERRINDHLQQDTLPVDTWANVRLFKVQDGGREWALFDTVGLQQLDLPEQECVLPLEHPSFDYAPGMLYTMAQYDASKGGVLGPNDTGTDLGGVNWRAVEFGEANVSPPRPVVRWGLDELGVPAAFRRQLEDAT